MLSYIDTGFSENFVIENKHNMLLNLFHSIFN